MRGDICIRRRVGYRHLPGQAPSATETVDLCIEYISITSLDNFHGQMKTLAFDRCRFQGGARSGRGAVKREGRVCNMRRTVERPAEDKY